MFPAISSNLVLLHMGTAYLTSRWIWAKVAPSKAQGKWRSIFGIVERR